MRFRCLSAVELLLLSVWSTKLELLGHKSHARAAQSRLGLASQRGQDGQFLYEFNHFGVPGGSFWAQGWMPEAILKNRGSSHARCYENDAKIAAQGRLWEHIGVLKGLLGRPWVQFARHFGSFGWYFARFVRKSVILRFRCLSPVELLLLAVWATKLELLGHKSHARAAQSRLGRASQRGQDSQVRPVGSVWLSELWDQSGLSPDPSQVGGQSLSI